MPNEIANEITNEIANEIANEINILFLSAYIDSSGINLSTLSFSPVSTCCSC